MPELHDDLRDTYRTDRPPSRLGCLLLVGAALISAGVLVALSTLLVVAVVL